MATQQGFIIYWSSKSFGFIRGLGKDRHDFFVHLKEFKNLPLGDQPKRGDMCEFELGTNSKGPCAKNVKLLYATGLEALAGEL
jgi:cold shock CspA family protein